MTDARAIIDEVSGRFNSVDLSNRRVVADHLVFVYHLIVASGPMLDIAAANIDTCQYRDFLIEHASGERDHAEWLRVDLTVSDICVHNPELMYDAATIAGAQYYLAMHVTPYALLGYMLVLECFSTSEASMNQLEAMHGTALLRTMRHHSVHDVDHGAEVAEQIDNMPLVYRELVRQNALRTVDALARVARRYGTFPAIAAHGAAD